MPLHFLLFRRFHVTQIRELLPSSGILTTIFCHKMCLRVASLLASPIRKVGPHCQPCVIHRHPFISGLILFPGLDKLCSHVKSREAGENSILHAEVHIDWEVEMRFGKLASNLLVKGMKCTVHPVSFVRLVYNGT